MYASIRRYRVRDGSMDDLMGRVDDEFAEEISRQPGFCSYAALDCGDAEVTTVSIFNEAEEAEASRELAMRWTEEKLGDMEFDRLAPLSGQILVSRAVEDLLEPMHAASSDEFASLRRYTLRRGSMDELMHIVDERFADRITDLPGFIGYHALDCGRGELCSVSIFAAQEEAEASDQMALDFVREELGAFDIERTEVIGGKVAVSRARADVLEPAHA